LSDAELQTWGTDLMNDTIFVGLDVHKATISVAIAGGARGGEIRFLGDIANRADHVGKLVERLGKTGQPLRFCYEAGPCRYDLRRLDLPRKSGEFF
jgi:transposase